jgi:hypothetical protein
MEDAFPIVIAIGLAIFGMFWIVGQAGDDFDIGFGEDEPDRMLIHSSNPGTIGESNEDFRTVDIGSFTAGELRGDVQAYTSDKENIKNKLIGNNEIVVNYNATQPGPGKVTFEVLGRDSPGKIYVKVNGNEVFKAATISGATPEINISQYQFKPGMNTIKIGTTRAGILGSTSYTLEEVKVSVEDRKFHDYTDYFQIYDYELEGFRPSNLTFQIPVDGSTPTQPLSIDVNDRTVFSQEIGRSTQNIELTPANADLSTGYNEIEFYTDGEAKYRIENAEIQIRYAVDAAASEETIEFGLNEDKLDYINRDSTDEKISFNYQKNTVSDTIQITVNDAIYNIDPENGPTSVQLDEDIFQKENQLTILGNQTFTLKNLQIISEKAE